MKSIKVVFVIIGIIALFFLIFFFTKFGNEVKPDILCNESYSEDCPVYIIQECKNLEGQKIYSVEFSCTDVPSKFFDSQLKYAATCGGMPLPSGWQYESSPLCRGIINCSKTITCR